MDLLNDSFTITTKDEITININVKIKEYSLLIKNIDTDNNNEEEIVLNNVHSE